jgi:hypothetical protein
MNPRTANPLALGSGSSKSTADTPTDQFSLKFCDAGEDAKDEPSIRGGGVNTFMQAHELDPKCPKLLQSVHQLAQAAGEPVVAIDNDHVYTPPATVSPKAIQFGPSLSASADPGVNEFTCDCPAFSRSVFAHLQKLRLG